MQRVFGPVEEDGKRIAWSEPTSGSTKTAGPRVGTHTNRVGEGLGRERGLSFGRPEPAWYVPRMI